MDRSVRRRLQAVCPGCDETFQSHHSFNMHLHNSEFCFFVDQHGANNTSVPTSKQQFPTSAESSDDQPKSQSKGVIPYESVTDNFNATLDDCQLGNVPENDNERESDEEPNDMPEPPKLLSPDIMAERVKTSKLFTNENRSCILLMHKLMVTGSPLHLFDDIIKWAEDAFMHGVRFDSQVPSRQKTLNDLEKMFKTAAMKPKSLPYQLESKRVESIPVFNFEAMLASLLHDERLMQPENLVIQPDNPAKFQKKYSLESGVLDELHTGTVCRESILESCLTPKDVFMGVVLYIDGTMLGNFTNAKLEPVMFSLSIFNRETRNQSFAWRPLGYIKRFADNVKGDNERADALKGRHNRNYHRALRLILKDLIQVQKRDVLCCDLVIGEHVNKDMKLKVKLVCAIGDCEGADDLCSRYASHSGNVESLCRDCNCLTKDADRTDLECTFRMRSDFDGASNEKLRQMSHYRCNNVFDDIDMCDNAGGISFSSPPEILHWKNLGLDKLAVSHFHEKVLGNGQNAKVFDRILGQVSASCQRQSDRNYPKVTFNKGFTSLSSKNIKAGEYAGLMLAYVIAWQTHAGKACYSARAGEEKHDEITEYIHQFEQLLACEAWMKDGKKELTTITGYRDTFVALMKNYKTTVKRTEGLGLKTTKFHQTRHIVEYILRFGSPENINSARNENHHIDNAKNPARTTQKRADVISEQTALRYYQKFVIDLAKHHVDANEVNTIMKQNPPLTTLLGTRCYLEVFLADNIIKYNVDFARNKPYHLNNELVQFLGESVLGDTAGSSLCIGTEVYLLDNILFRAHAAYRGKGSWHDFCYYKTAQMVYERIAKIWCVVELSSVSNHGDMYDPGLYAVVTRSTRHVEPHSVLLSSAVMDFNEKGKPNFCIISVAEITSPAFVVENMLSEATVFDEEDERKVWVVNSKLKWIEEF